MANTLDSPSDQRVKSALEKSGFSIGGVSPVGWVNAPEITLIDEALNDYEVAWAAAGHPHSVYPTDFEELLRVTSATPMVVGI